jgi:anti-anti-sigma factor
MKVSVENYNHASLLIVEGDMVSDDLEALQVAVDHELESERVVDIVLNMEHVAFVDSATIEYLLDVEDRLVERLGQVKLANCSDEVHKILEMTRLAKEFEIFESVDDAIKSMTV